MIKLSVEIVICSFLLPVVVYTGLLGISTALMYSDIREILSTHQELNEEFSGSCYSYVAVSLARRGILDLSAYPINPLSRRARRYLEGK